METFPEDQTLQLAYGIKKKDRAIQQYTKLLKYADGDKLYPNYLMLGTSSGRFEARQPEFQIPHLPVIQSLLPQSYNNCFELKLDDDFHTLLGLNTWKLPSLDTLSANDFLFVDIAYLLNITAKNSEALFTFLRLAGMQGVKWMLYARSTPAIIDQYQLYYQILEDEDGELPFLFIFNYGPNG